MRKSTERTLVRHWCQRCDEDMSPEDYAHHFDTNDRCKASERTDQFILQIEWHRESLDQPALPPTVGPFRSRAEAEWWAGLNIPNGSWSVTPVTPPDRATS